MNRAAWLFLLLGMIQHAPAQQQPPAEKPADTPAVLRETADKAAEEWDALSKGLEQKIATLLPCDPKSRAAVEEVSHASEARLAALSAYLKAEAAKAKLDMDQAKQVLAAQAAIAGGWNTERAEADQQGTAIEAQMADLRESMRKRGSLLGAQQALAEIETMVKERSTKSEDLGAHKESLDALLGDLVAAYQDRQAALENESALLDAETAKWNAYYTARIARAITECSIINGGAAQRRKRP
jgi:hypothetical protein